MMNNNKILTVSYGTFSCTLEGFDDSFGTMKAIAEYFRDLSADDRYFGSEPIQPDAQMLARIAEREISRHVEAREDQGRIVLSAQAGPQAAALVAENTLDDVAEAVADATIAKARDMGTSERVALTSDSNVEAATATGPVVADDVDLAMPETDTAETADATVQEKSQTEAAKPHQPEIVPSLPDEDVDAFFADRPTPAATQETAVTPAPSVADAADEDDAFLPDRAKADSIADKLKRIRAVVSQQAEAAQEPDYSEDQHAEANTARVAKAVHSEADVENDTAGSSGKDVLADTLRDLEEALDADDEYEVEDTAGVTDEESDEDDIAALLSRLESEAGAAEQAQDGATREPADEEYSDEYRADEDQEDALERNILASIDTIEAGTDLDDSRNENLFEDAQESVEITDDAPASDTTPGAPRTRILKVKRATLEAAIAAGQLEEYDDEEDADQADTTAETAPLRKAPLADTSSLTAEAEDELARELAELEADMRGEGAAADPHNATKTSGEADLADEVAEDDTFANEDAAFEDGDAPTEGDEGDTQPAQAARSEITGSTDKDFSRLMEESNHQMEEPEAATRRDAFAHLRAAVAAKKADEAAGDTPLEEETDEAYRDDLANVVRPRRPVTDTDRRRTERPADARPAPLKLVAEQRIDVDPSRSTAPVRPRRVSAMASAPTAIPEDAMSFTDFAAEMGAVKLPDLLEAAAAYLSFVEGHEEFSRPQLMTKVRQVEQENFTREDSLRSFGKLLREGKIEKLKGGRFQASDQIGFKPDARAAG